jgi:hypothetical protein
LAHGILPTRRLVQYGSEARAFDQAPGAMPPLFRDLPSDFFDKWDVLSDDDAEDEAAADSYPDSSLSTSDRSLLATSQSSSVGPSSVTSLCSSVANPLAWYPPMLDPRLFSWQTVTLAFTFGVTLGALGAITFTW